jgi:tetratricopeptide (TPR) repeat protein
MLTKRAFSLLFLIVAAAIPLLAASTDQGKIPITTSSDKALQAYLKGRDLTEKLRATDSIAHFDEAIAADPNMAVAYLSRAQVQPTANGFFDDMKKAEALAPKASDGERMWIEGVQAAADGFPKKQRENYEALVAKYPNDERAHNLLGGAYFAVQKWDLAAEQYQKAIAINPDFTLPYNMLGYADRFMEKFDDSEKAFQKYIQLIPKDPNPYDSYGELLQKIGKFDPSIVQYRKALEQDAHFLASRIGIATDLNLKGDHAAARTEIQKLLELARNDGEQRAGYFAMAVSYADEGNLPKALDSMEKSYAVAAESKDAASMAADLNVMGNILLEANRPDDALSRFDKANDLIAKSNLSQDVKNNTKQNHLGNQTLVSIKKKAIGPAKASADEYRKGLTGNNQFQAWLSHQLDGMIALEEKKYDVAVEQLQQANSQDPYNLYRLGMAYQGKGDAAKAQEMFRKSANFNALNSLQQSFVRAKAQKAASA